MATINMIIRLNVLFSIIVFAAAVGVALSWPQSVREASTVSVAASAACAHISPDLSLIANAAYAVDLKTGKALYAKNANDQLPLASLTKLATALTAFDTLSPDDTITISKEALTPDGDAGLRVGEEWNAGSLLDYTLMVSANDGIHAIALAAAEKKNEDISAFIEQINQKVRSLGLASMNFESDTGLDISTTTASAFGSARDVASLIAYIAQNNPRLVENTREESKTFTSESGYVHNAANTSGVIGSLTSGIASKTGYTDISGGNLAIVFEPIVGRPVAAVVLGSTREGRDSDMQALAAGAKTALKRMIVCGDGTDAP